MTKKQIPTRITIWFDTDGAAFRSPRSGDYDEMAFSSAVTGVLTRVRGKIIGQLSREEGCICTAPEADDKIMDINGNTIGTLVITWKVEDDE